MPEAPGCGRKYDATTGAMGTLEGRDVAGDGLGLRCRVPAEAVELKGSVVPTNVEPLEFRGSFLDDAVG